MDPLKLRLRICLIMVVGVMALGFMVAEGWSLEDAFCFA